MVPEPPPGNEPPVPDTVEAPPEAVLTGEPPVALIPEAPPVARPPLAGFVRGDVPPVALAVAPPTEDEPVSLSFPPQAANTLAKAHTKPALSARFPTRGDSDLSVVTKVIMAVLCDKTSCLCEH